MIANNTTVIVSISFRKYQLFKIPTVLFKIPTVSPILIGQNFEAVGLNL